jgi:putative hydrolase of the HAD superfamily
LCNPLASNQSRVDPGFVRVDARLHLPDYLQRRARPVNPEHPVNPVLIFLDQHMNLKTEKPHQISIVFFDAGGTLFETRGSVGEIYAQAAARYGLAADAEKLQAEFLRAFARQPPLAFPQKKSVSELLRLEKQWWRNLVREVMPEAGSSVRFEEFYEDLYEFFRGNQAWQLFDDVIPTLETLRQQGLRLSIISNFDSRLEDVLSALNIAQYFSSVHISSRTGAAKPEAAIFQAALQQHHVSAAAAMHIGDSLREDFYGAQNAGLTGVWLDRNPEKKTPDGLRRISRLVELSAMLL